MGHVINPYVPTYGLPGDHIADKSHQTHHSKPKQGTVLPSIASRSVRTRRNHIADSLSHQRRCLIASLSCTWPNLLFVFIFVAHMTKPNICLPFTISKLPLEKLDSTWKVRKLRNFGNCKIKTTLLIPSGDSPVCCHDTGPFFNFLITLSHFLKKSTRLSLVERPH